MTVRESQTDGCFDCSRPGIEDRYTVVPASFVVFDIHTGQTIQIDQGVDAGVRAAEHARRLRARNHRLAREAVAGARN